MATSTRDRNGGRDMKQPPWVPPEDDDNRPIPTHPGGEREDILRARPVPREASSQAGQWAGGHIPGTRKDRKVKTHRKLT